MLRHKSWFNPENEPFQDMRDAYAPLVWQCRYGGIEVPSRLWKYVEFGRGRKYSDNQAEHLARDSKVLAKFDAWTDAFARFVNRKGRAPPGRWKVARQRRALRGRREDLRGCPEGAAAAAVMAAGHPDRQHSCQ
ncbi:MAG: hypothetical protein AAB074_19970 [Planctomycetota bacterium]